MGELIQEPEMEVYEEDDQCPIDPSYFPLSNSHINLHCHPPCSSCGCNCGAAASNPMKRPPPSSSSLPSQQDPEPKLKKLFLDHGENLSCGYSKIALPCPFGAHSSGPSSARNSTLTHYLPPLRRSVSDPSDAIAIINGGNSIAPSSKKGPVSISALPPQPHGLRRTVSDPNPSPETFSQPPTKTDIGSKIMKEESPESKRLKRIKERLKEMNQLWNEMIQEQEEKAEVVEGFVDNVNGAKEEGETEFEETVEVERVDESIILRFNCPCSKGYKILLSGNSCYYKLD